MENAIEELQGRQLACLLLIGKLLQRQPDLLRELVDARESFIATALAQSMSDSAIRTMQEAFDGVLQLAGRE